ncbi:cell adhesion molecule DSCAM-like isoform X4 [Panonychus citri]|uniref:cell adhesion molecule DSCAM-like isoform X4 n=1 Tax=Panonychus citri TaxID=50023 RepID=UPI002307A751|nr:cell adhesion molecule DSCAM-like isoform X4 [Panonychus citri]XP_053206715.1 cell adhesion molecule DSCAM-like isoform X4 [Panonychus citri]
MESNLIFGLSSKFQLKMNHLLSASLTFFVLVIKLSYQQETPKVAPFSSLVKPVIGGKTSFTCQSISGSPPLHVTWYKDGNEILDSLSIRIQSNGDPSILIIDSIQSSHSGNYTCKMSNRFGQDSYTSEILVQGSPNWISKPVDVKSTLGDSLTIQCSASGYPKPIIQWKKFQGSWINLSSNGTTNENVQQSSEKLILSNASRDTGGRYGCSVANGIRPDL